MSQQERLANGPAAAAILAAGVGSFALGLFTSLAEAFPTFGNAINFYSPTGPLSGKTVLTVAAWLIAWVATYGLWRRKEVDFGRVYAVTLVLILLGLLGTFPLFFELFTG